MQRLDLPPSNIPFSEHITKLSEYLLPFMPMWRSYWLRAVAVRDGEQWRLCYLSLIGQWSEFPHVEQFCDHIPESALIAVSQPIDETRIRQILTSLRDSSKIDLPYDITATVPNKAVSNQPYWQVPTPWVPPDHVAEVIEDGRWRYLQITDSMAWPETARNEMPVRQALRADLDLRSERDFETFLANKFSAGQPQYGQQNLSDFRYFLDFPLALVVQHGPIESATKTRSLAVACRQPLALEELRVTAGKNWSSDANVLPIESISSAEGWSTGAVRIPYQRSKVWFTSALLAKSLYYEIPVPTPGEQTTEVVGHLYNPRSSVDGIREWGTHLLASTGPHFEVALLNALTRLGIPVLFAGQVQKDGEIGGPATPGFDFVALDHAKKLAAVISAKGTARSPSDDDVQKLLDGAAAIGQLYADWRVFSIIACHAPASRLGRFADRDDVRVWGREDLAVLQYAIKRETIEQMLWATSASPLESVYWAMPVEF